MVGSLNQIATEPVACESGNFLQRAALFEQVRGSRDNYKPPVRAAEVSQSQAVQFSHLTREKNHLWR